MRISRQKLLIDANESIAAQSKPRETRGRRWTRPASAGGLEFHAAARSPAGHRGDVIAPRRSAFFGSVSDSFISSPRANCLFPAHQMLINRPASSCSARWPPPRILFVSGLGRANFGSTCEFPSRLSRLKRETPRLTRSSTRQDRLELRCANRDASGDSPVKHSRLVMTRNCHNAAASAAPKARKPRISRGARSSRLIGRGSICRMSQQVAFGAQRKKKADKRLTAGAHQLNGNFRRSQPSLPLHFTFGFSIRAERRNSRRKSPVLRHHSPARGSLAAPNGDQLIRS